MLARGYGNHERDQLIPVADLVVSREQQSERRKRDNRRCVYAICIFAICLLIAFLVKPEPKSQENNDRKHFSWGRREPEDSKERTENTYLGLPSSSPTSVPQLVAQSPEINLLAYSFTEYLKDFKKSYSIEEMDLREKNFNANVAAAIEQNSKKKSWTETVNKFSDKLEKPIKGIDKEHLFKSRAPSDGVRPDLSAKGKIALPESLDYRSQGVLTPIKDQGYCGSCWAFAATESLESHIALQTGNLYTLSEQEFVSCVHGGCSGSTMEQAFSFAESNGLVAEWTTPYVSYKGYTGTCSVNKAYPTRVAGITGYEVVPSNSYDDLILALAETGPIAVTVDASEWSRYSSGIFSGCSSTPSLDHGVLLVGYGHDADLAMDYWLVRNSWGPDWGEGGYIRLQRTSDEASVCGVDQPYNVTVCGTCGILYDASYPTGGYLV